jgi:glycosyltransferase 2 family protein
MSGPNGGPPPTDPSPPGETLPPGDVPPPPTAVPATEAPATEAHATADPATDVPATEAPPTEEVSAAQLSLGRRLREPRTIVSIVLPILLLVIFARSLPGFHLEELPDKILAANGLILLAALVVFYLGFPLRGLRWAGLLRATGFRLGTRDATEIIFISWLVNCLVPAKLGDVYRAYLLKINSTVSLSRTFGTVFIERVLDLFAITALGLASGYVSFRNGLPTAVQAVFFIGGAFLVVLTAALFTMRNFGRRILTRLPLPNRIVEFYDRFEEGVFSAIGLRALPRLIVLTGLIWATEGFRLYLVLEALGFKDVHLGISGAFFVALTGSLLTAVPLTPAGIGVVETGVVFVLTVAYGISQPEALAITLVDRAISVLSIIALGSIGYAVSPLRRGAGLRGYSPSRGGPPATVEG